MLKLGQNVTYKGKAGTITNHPVHGHYDKHTDMYWVLFQNGATKKAKFVPAEELNEQRVMEKIAKVAIKRALNKFTINEELTTEDYREIRNFIRKEIATIFYDLFRKRTTWV